MNKLCFSAALSITVLSLSACVLTSREKLPKDMKTKEQIWNEHFREQEKSLDQKAQGVRHYTDSDPLQGLSYIRHSHNETRSLFQRLPNPDLVLYVFPHVKGVEQTPVPGYTTIFPMYLEVHYAMPGEVPPRTRELDTKPITPPGIEAKPEDAKPVDKDRRLIKALYK